MRIKSCFYDSRRSVSEGVVLIDLAFGFQLLATQGAHCSRTTIESATAARLEAARDAALLKRACRSSVSFSIKLLETR